MLRNHRVFSSFIFALLLAGCAGQSYLQGVTPSGEKVYLGTPNIENTEEFKTYLVSPRSEVDKQRFIFQRLKDATELQFYHDGTWYNSVQAYRGGMWLMRNRYVKGQNTNEFIKKYVERSTSGNQHLVKFPNGSIHVGSAIVYNELALVEEAAKKHPRR